MATQAKLIFLCGKMAAEKSTLAIDLAKQKDAMLMEHLPPRTPWTTQADFDAINACFQPPRMTRGFMSSAIRAPSERSCSCRASQKRSQT